MQPPKGVEAYSGQSYASLEKIAAHVRARLVPHHGLSAPIPGLELFERLDEYGVTVRGQALQLEYGVEELPPGLEAQAHFSIEEGAIVVELTPSTYEDLRLGIARALFTLCHEIGHAILHPAELVDRRLAAANGTALHRGAVAAHPHYKDTEWQANGFAAAMLMPAVGLVELEQAHPELSAELLSQVFAVSLQAAELRMKVFADRRRELLPR
jgi:hypothetical protein